MQPADADEGEDDSDGERGVLVWRTEIAAPIGFRSGLEVALDLGLLTVTGTFAVLYAPAAPLRRRAATVAGIGLGLVVATSLGAFTAGSHLAFAVTAVLLATVTAGLCLALTLSACGGPDRPAEPAADGGH